MFKERRSTSEVEVLMVDIAGTVGDALGDVVVAIVEAVIPVIEELIPALIRGIQLGWGAIKEGVEGYEADIITLFTILIIFVGSFITARGILSRGTMVGVAPRPISIPVVGPV
tara:strand:- start:2125 stop:2463 length:339 start_codon:yes stop_codon:yes gene_type:complete